MTHDVRWYDDAKQIIYVTLRDAISYEELYGVFDACVSLLNTVSNPTVIVHDLTGLKSVFSVNVVALGKIPQHPLTDHPNRLCSYFAGPNLRSKVILDVAQRLFPRMMSSVYTTETVESALIAAQEKLSQASSKTILSD